MKLKNTWYNISRNAVTNTTAEVYVYDEIGFWGVTAQEFAQELNALEGIELINLHVNTPGGSVVDVLAMMQALKNHPAKVVAYIDGLAASSGSRLILAADEIEIAENAFIMIHNVWTVAGGNAKALRKEAAVLEKFDDGLANDYAKRIDRTPEEIHALMEADTWFNAQEALEIGLVDRIGAEQKAAACVSEHFINRVGDFGNVPEDWHPQVKLENSDPAPDPKIDTDTFNPTPLDVLMRKQALLEITI
jgi:ATP-dependent protease ClpP protease subunit